MFGWKLKNKREYDHVISLGYNCEVAFQFYLKYRFTESSLFAWVNSKNIGVLNNALRNLDVIGSQGYQKAGGMYKDIATGICFHGKDNDENYPDEASQIAELTSRNHHLVQKFREVSNDGKRTLFIYKYLPHGENEESVKANVLELYGLLKNMSANDFDMLIIMEKKTFPLLNLEQGRIFIRRVKFFTSEDRVTTKPYDQCHYGKIFTEFAPAFILENHKKYKFEK